MDQADSDKDISHFQQALLHQVQLRGQQGQLLSSVANQALLTQISQLNA